MSCKRTLEIGAYVDGELNPSEAAAVQRHLDECDACSRDYHYHLALRSSLGDSSLYYRTPLELKMRIRSISQTEEQSEASKRPMLPW
ncbi:MAG TPA: zf-HC2 domain-containing protein [Pyrinomonadaceae bacterium]|nr:zf-HC2 domain-containing protein [Pyrinomonadaceae bacterium]